MVFDSIYPKRLSNLADATTPGVNVLRISGHGNSSQKEMA